MGAPPQGGSLSRSLLASRLKPTSVLAPIVTFLTLTVFLTPVLDFVSDTPKAVLATVLVTSVWKDVFLTRGEDKIMGITAFLTVACGPTVGFLVGYVVSLPDQFMDYATKYNGPRGAAARGEGVSSRTRAQTNPQEAFDKKNA